MIENWIDSKDEPKETKYIPIDTIFNAVSLKSEYKKWLHDLLSEDEIPDEIQSDLENSFRELINKSIEIGSNSFKVLFLFYYRGDYKSVLYMLPDNFDENKLLLERIKIIPDLFTQKQNGKPVVFQAYVAHILDGIQIIAKPGSAFLAAYSKNKQEIREASSLTERGCYYIKLQDLQKHADEIKEKPTALFDESEVSFLQRNADEKYSMSLVSELEETSCNISVFLPFLLYGKEQFISILIAFLALLSVDLDDKNFFVKFKEINKIPQWNEKNNIHEIFFELAIKYKEISIIDMVFKEVDVARIPSVFFNYICNPNPSFYRELIKGEYSNLIEPIRSVIEYFDQLLITIIIKNPHQIYDKRLQVFIDYIKYMGRKAPERKTALLQELSSMKYNDQDNDIQNILNSIVEEFTNIDTQKADTFYNERDLKKYYGKIKPKTSEEALLAVQDWYDKFPGTRVNFGPEYYISEFIDRGEYISRNFFNPFSDDEEFVCRFLSIPQNLQWRNNTASIYWVLSFLAYWIVKHDENQDASNVFEAATHLLMREKITFPPKIINFILSNNELDKINENITHKSEINEADLFLYNVFAAINENDKCKSILEVICEPEKHFPIYFIQYYYNHDEFVQQEFLDFLFALNKQVPKFKQLSKFFKDEDEEREEIYPLDIIKAACKEDKLTKQIVLKKLPDYIINCKQRKKLLSSEKLKKHFSYLIDMKNDECQKDSIIDFITVFYKRAIQETEPSCIELYTFLSFYSYFRDNADLALLMDFTDHLETIKTKCGKMLRNFRFIEQENISEDERNFRYDCAWLAANCIFDKTEKAWKAIKPLIIAFRMSKKTLLLNNLNWLPSTKLLEMISAFFNIGNQKILKELREDMANDFIDYFTPIKNTKTRKQEEQYTKYELDEEGFTLELREPSPFWRYAYIRALADLGVKMDSKGHFFHQQLEKISQTDPSKKIREAAMKTQKKLDANRSGITGANHYKSLFEAFWWLRYAHMRSLGEEIDIIKANDLRIWEWK